MCILPALAQQPPLESAPKPAIHMDLAALGYTGLSQGARLSGIVNVSLDFVDAQHVLLTFNPKKLFKRLPDCPPTHNDRVMHAMVVEVPSGKVVKEADWYLHDTRPYLWPMGPGRFLLRRLNQLYEVDANLSERLALDSPKDLQWVSVTPNGKQIIAETIEQQADGKAKDKARVKIAFIDADLLVVQRVMESRGTVNLHATDSGFADVHETGAGVWLVRFGPALRDRANITRVKAKRSPNIIYSSANTLLVGRCAGSGDGYIVSAFTVTGTSLWKQHWNECRYTPTVAGSEDGSRFAVATLTIPPPSTKTSSASEESEEESVGQTVQVFDTASGNSVLSVKATPAVLDGHNFSLSSDGTRLAVLEGLALDVYSLREMSAEERTKYAAVKSDIPAPYVPLSAPGATQTAAMPDEEIINISAASDDTASEEGPSGTASSTPAPTIAAPIATDAQPASAKANAAPPALTLRTGTQVVALDVVVTDSKGHLVKGLQQSDFVVAEDAKPQSVRYFKEYAGAGAQPGAQAPPAQPVKEPVKEEKETLAPNIFSNYSQPKEAGAVTVVVFDLLNTQMADQAHAQAELVKFLKTKPKDSQFALCVLGANLQMIQGFTQDENLLLAAAKGKKASMRHRPVLASDSPFESMLDSGKATTKFLPQLDFFVESIALQEAEVRGLDADRRMFMTVDAFAHLARYLSGIPGRKNLLWLSGSFTLGLSPDSDAQSPFMAVRNFSENLKRVSNLLAESHVAVYPVDVKGLVTDPMFTAASNDGLVPVSIQGSTPSVVGPHPRNASTSVGIAAMQNQAEQFGLSQIGEHATMDQLAKETGGRAFYNTNGIAKAITTAAEEGANYYALSYTPANKNYNGGFRKIKVLIAGKKYNLAYRNGYYAVDPYALAKPAKDMTSSLSLAAMQHGSPQSRQIVFGARVVPVGKPRTVKDAPAASAKPAKSKHKGEAAPVEMQLYSIDYAVTSADLRFSQASDGMYHDILNFMTASFDDEGKQDASQISQMAADLKPEVFRNILQTGLRLHQEVDVPVKSTSLRLGVEDIANSHIGTLEIPLPVKAPPDAPVAVRRAMPPVERD